MENEYDIDYTIEDENQAIKDLADYEKNFLSELIRLNAMTTEEYTAYFNELNNNEKVK
jgi:hypothetical protein